MTAFYGRPPRGRSTDHHHQRSDHRPSPTTTTITSTGLGLDQGISSGLRQLVMVSWERRSQLVSWRRSSQTFVSQQLVLVGPLEKDRKILLLNAVHSCFGRRSSSVFRSSSVRRSSSSVFRLLSAVSSSSIFRSSSVNRASSLPAVFYTHHPTVRLHRQPTISSTEVRTSTLVQRLQHLSCRELCNALSSAGQQKTTPSPSSLGSVSL